MGATVQSMIDKLAALISAPMAIATIPSVLILATGPVISPIVAITSVPRPPAPLRSATITAITTISPIAGTAAGGLARYAITEPSIFRELSTWVGRRVCPSISSINSWVDRRALAIEEVVSTGSRFFPSSWHRGGEQVRLAEPTIVEPPVASVALRVLSGLTAVAATVAVCLGMKAAAAIAAPAAAIYLNT